jgi:DNA-binding CsgD family transcriptional regulator
MRVVRPWRSQIGCLPRRLRRNASVQRIQKNKRILTPREREVLGWVARGKSAAGVAEILNIAKRTVDEHVQTAIHKLGAAKRTRWPLRYATASLTSSTCASQSPEHRGKRACCADLSQPESPAHKI